MRGRATPDGVLLVDKPPGLTSTRALAMAKRALQASKAGHTGTLDPFATGLLPLVFGEATKFSRFALDGPKAYDAVLSLGEETPTGDTESSVSRRIEDIPNWTQIKAVAHTFVGDITQTPPMHSAVHVGGRRLYEYAREGVEVARSSRTVRVFSLRVGAIDGRRVKISLECSKGTYVRVLAADIGRALGCGAYLVELRRTAVGAFAVADAVTLEHLVEVGPEQARLRLLPSESLVTGLPRMDIGPEATIRFVQGQPIDGASIDPREPTVAVFGTGSRFLGVGVLDGERIAPSRLLAQAAKSPDFA